MGEKELSKVLEHYECENQITLEEYLWSVGHYMALPVEESEEQEGGKEENVYDANSR